MYQQIFVLIVKDSYGLAYYAKAKIGDQKGFIRLVPARGSRLILRHLVSEKKRFFRSNFIKPFML